MRVQVPLCISLILLLLILSYQTSPQYYNHNNNSELKLPKQNSPFLPPEKIQFRHLTIEDGLSNNFIWSLLKDRKGFVWIATVDGLNRYDGRKIKVYRNSPDDTNSLSSNYVRALCEDETGTLWIGTDKGLNKYNPEQENFTRYINQDDSTSLSNLIITIFEDRSGVLWSGTNHGGLTSFDRGSEKFINYRNIPDDPTSLSNDFVWTIYEDSEGNLWIGTIGGGLNKFNHENKNFTRFQFDPYNLNTLRDNRVPCICEDKSGALWISTFGGGISRFIYRGDQHPPVITHFMHNPNDPASISGNDIDYIMIDENDIMWFGTAQGGLNRTISSVSKNPAPSFISYKHDPNDPSSLLGNNIPYIYKDNAGLFWIVNYQEGMNIYDTRQKQFRCYRHEPDNPSSLSGGQISSVYEDKSGILWIGNWENGLNKWDRVKNKFTHYKNNPNDPTSISSNRVVSIYGDSWGDIWVGTYSNGLNKLDRGTGKFYTYLNNPLNPKSISESVLSSIVEDTAGVLWVATGNQGLNRFDRESKSFTNINHNPDSLKILSSNFVSAIYLIDKSGHLWLRAKSNGLIEYDHQKDEFINYKFDPDDTNSMSSNGVTCVYEDKSGTYWIGTGEGGLNKFNKESGRFRRYSVEDGLPSDWITEVLEDDSGNLWIGTNNGLSKFNPQKETFKNYTTEDGLLSNQIGPGCRSKTGELIFSNDDGFIIFHPDSIKANLYIPPVYITDFYLFNKPVPIGYDSLSGRTILRKSIIECDELVLNYDDKVFSFEFAALDYHAPMKNKYAYKMEGFNRDWTNVDAGYRLVTYTNLDPGEYVFRVKGCNNDGVWNETGASIKIIILPPWYQTTLAYLIYVLLTGSLIYFVWKAQLRRIKINHEYEMSRFEAQKLHEVDEIKSRFFANISHEFRTPLTLILGPAKDIIDIAKEIKVKQNAGLIQRNAVKLLSLVNQLLDLSKIEAGRMKLEAKKENIIPLLKGFVLSFTSYAERKNIKLKFTSNEDDIEVYLDRNKLEKIITNILSNAFKFTPEGGKIEFTIERLSKEIEIRVSDSGIGIPKGNIDKIFDRFYQVDGSHTREQEGTGIGLSLTKELVELHKGRIEVQSEEGKGTNVILRIPLGEEHLKPEEILKTEEEQQQVVYEKEKISTKYEYVTERLSKDKIADELVEKDALPLLLIVEDNFDVRFYIKANLNKEYKIIEAIDGEDGWNTAIEQIPDLIVSDVMMPKMDGFKLCDKLKTDQRTSHIPVVLLTAKAAKEDKLEGYETGADDYIMKPFDPDELRSRIKNLLMQRKRLHEHFQKEGLIELYQTKITSIDKKFMQKVYETINNHISDSHFSMDEFAEHLNISKSLMHKKIAALTGEPPGELIRRIRLKKAAELIDKKFGNLSEIALEVGFSNPAYFSEAFKKQFGVTPSHYQRNNKTA